MARVVGAEHIEEVRAKGLRHFELLPGDIVTSLAEEAASRLSIKLIEGPIERPTPHRTDGATMARRATLSTACRTASKYPSGYAMPSSMITWYPAHRQPAPPCSAPPSPWPSAPSTTRTRKPCSGPSRCPPAAD